jgi:putative nucleotidyltransferase with HDIG domain
VRQLFADYLAPAHGFDHAERVSRWAVQIAKAEKVDVFLSELAAVLHDIGRVTEHAKASSKTHHELSYEMCQQWFREDKNFDVLSKIEKLQILYSLRYHWNDQANKYSLAWVLRDADKLDSLGAIGLKRSIEFFKGNEDKILQDVRFKSDMLLHVRTVTAQKIIEQKKMFAPIEKYHAKLLRKKIKPVEL